MSDTIEAYFANHYVTRIFDDASEAAIMEDDKSFNPPNMDDFGKNIDTAMPEPTQAEREQLAKFLEIILSDKPLDELPRLVSGDSGELELGVLAAPADSSSYDFGNKSVSDKIRTEIAAAADKESRESRISELDEVLLEESLKGTAKEKDTKRSAVKDMIDDLELDDEIVSMQDESIQAETDRSVQESAQTKSGTPEDAPEPPPRPQSAAQRHETTEQNTGDDIDVDVHESTQDVKTGGVTMARKKDESDELLDSLLAQQEPPVADNTPAVTDFPFELEPEPDIEQPSLPIQEAPPAPVEPVDSGGFGKEEPEVVSSGETEELADSPVSEGKDEPAPQPPAEEKPSATGTVKSNAGNLDWLD